MRYLFGFLGVWGLVLIPLLGCDMFPFETCEGVVCPPDSNVCTIEYCSGGSCISAPVEENGMNCTYDGLSGVCVDGVCGENLCEGVVCDDGLSCTRDECDFRDGVCHFTNLCDDGNDCTEDNCNPLDGLCDYTTPVEDGTVCNFREEELLGLGTWALGTCEAGVCVGPCDPASEEALKCPILNFDDLDCCPGGEGCRHECESGF